MCSAFCAGGRVALGLALTLVVVIAVTPWQNEAHASATGVTGFKERLITVDANLAGKTGLGVGTKITIQKGEFDATITGQRRMQKGFSGGFTAVSNLCNWHVEAHFTNPAGRVIHKLASPNRDCSFNGKASVNIEPDLVTERVDPRRASDPNHRGVSRVHIVLYTNFAVEVARVTHNIEQ
jgi:hypothetical protein